MKFWLFVYNTWELTFRGDDMVHKKATALVEAESEHQATVVLQAYVNHAGILKTEQVKPHYSQIDYEKGRLIEHG